MTNDIQPPVLSVLLANYNHGQFLDQCLTALINQDYHSYEMLVIDDGSTDNSVEIIERYARESDKITFLKNEKNIGGLKSMKRIMKHARGDYLYFAAADDMVLPGFFKQTMALLTEYPQAGFCSALSKMIDEAGSEIGMYLSPLIRKNACYISPPEARKTLLSNGSWFLGNTTIYHRDSLSDAGGFYQELGPFADGFIQQVIALRKGVCFIPLPMAVWRQTDSGSYSSRAYADGDKTLAITNCAVTLMKTEYHNLFPARYIRKWERLMKFRTGMVTWGGIWSQQKRSIREIQKMFVNQRSPLNRFLVILMKFFGACYLFFWLIVLIISIKPPLGWIFKRLLLAAQNNKLMHLNTDIENILSRI